MRSRCFGMSVMLTGVVCRVHVSVLTYLQGDECSNETKDTEHPEIVQDGGGFITVSGIICSTLLTGVNINLIAHEQQWKAPLSCLRYCTQSIK